MTIDASVIKNGHVVWQLLTTAQQADLEANYPRHPTITPPAPYSLAPEAQDSDDSFGGDGGIGDPDELADNPGEAVDPRFEAWLDTAYMLRHATDTIADDPYA